MAASMQGSHAQLLAAVVNCSCINLCAYSFVMFAAILIVIVLGGGGGSIDQV